VLNMDNSAPEYPITDGEGERGYAGRSKPAVTDSATDLPWSSACRYNSWRSRRVIG
jgi:hypothetical protein